VGVIRLARVNHEAFSFWLRLCRAVFSAISVVKNGIKSRGGVRQRLDLQYLGFPQRLQKDVTDHRPGNAGDHEKEEQGIKGQFSAQDRAEDEYAQGDTDETRSHRFGESGPVPPDPPEDQAYHDAAGDASGKSKRGPCPDCVPDNGSHKSGQSCVPGAHDNARHDVDGVLKGKSFDGPGGDVNP